MNATRIAFLGTGIMGFQMARRLAEAGFALSAWNRTRAKAEPLAKSGAMIADTPAEAAKDADAVILMLSDGPACDNMLFEQGVSDAMTPGSTLIVMSSIPVETSRAQARRLADAGLDYLDAPVSGGQKGATEGSLAIMAGGDDAVFARHRAMFEAMGRPVLVGPAGSGQLAKLCNQLIVASTISTVAEALLLAKKGGADPVAVRRALMGGFADSTIMTQHGERMLCGNFEPGGASVMQLKDCRTIAALADTLELDLPLMQQATALYESFVEHGGGQKDHSGVYLELARRNGIDVS